MNQLSINIAGIAYNLKFGYGVFRRLSIVYKLSSYTALGEYMGSLKFGEVETISFEQLDFMGNIVKCAIEYNLNAPVEITLEEVVDELMANADQLEAVMLAFTESFPKELEDEGKQKRGTNKPPARKKRK